MKKRVFHDNITKLETHFLMPNFLLDIVKFLRVYGEPVLANDALANFSKFFNF